jgi:hypothetical protein
LQSKCAKLAGKNTRSWQQSSRQPNNFWLRKVYLQLCSIECNTAALAAVAASLAAALALINSAAIPRAMGVCNVGRKCPDSQMV